MNHLPYAVHAIVLQHQLFAENVPRLEGEVTAQRRMIIKGWAMEIMKRSGWVCYDKRSGWVRDKLRKFAVSKAAMIKSTKARAAPKTHLPIADMNPGQLNEASVIDARTTPPQICDQRRERVEKKRVCIPHQ